MGNTYNRVHIWCCKYGENRYCERCANKKLCASKHTGLLNSCLGKLCLHPYLVVPLISARVTLISTRVSAHCQAILLPRYLESQARPFTWFSMNSLGQINTGYNSNDETTQLSLWIKLWMSRCCLTTSIHVSKRRVPFYFMCLIMVIFMALNSV